jgi:TRAP-type C4-dicarboxylate transport system permease small subunit
MAVVALVMGAGQAWAVRRHLGIDALRAFLPARFQALVAGPAG